MNSGSGRPVPAISGDHVVEVQRAAVCMARVNEWWNKHALGRSKTSTRIDMCLENRDGTEDIFNALGVEWGSARRFNLWQAFEFLQTLKPCSHTDDPIGSIS